MRRKEQLWQIGDVFLIPTSDELVTVGQVIGREPDLPRSATVALFDERHKTHVAARDHSVLDTNALYAVLFVTTHNLDSGNWLVIGHRAVAVDANRIPYEYTRSNGFMGAKVIGANIVNRFVNAFYGLAPWDDWKDPNYLDSLLVSKSAKPLARLVYKKD